MTPLNGMHRPLSLRVYASADLGFSFPVTTVDLKVHPKVRVLDLACDVVPENTLDQWPQDMGELTLVLGGQVLDGYATLGDELFPRLAQGRRTTVIVTPMKEAQAA